MLTKRERFVRWRGTKAHKEKEQRGILTALLVDDYRMSINDLDVVRTDFANNLSKPFRTFNSYNQGGVGVLLYCKLKIEEVIEQLPSTAIEERELLIELNGIIEVLYDNPTSDSAKKFNSMVKTTRQLLELKTEHIVDKKLAKILCIDLYILLKVIGLTVDELYWWQKLAVNAVINLDSGMKDITLLMQMAENKVGQLDRFIEASTKERLQRDTAVIERASSTKLKKTIQEYFNEDFLRLMNFNGLEDQPFSLLEKKMEQVAGCIDRIIIKRNKKEEIKLKIGTIQTLLNRVDENDKKTDNKQSFINIINANLDLFTILLENSNELEKETFTNKIMQLNAPDLYSSGSIKVINTMSWITSGLSNIYRAYTPKVLQNALSGRILSLEGECKTGLKDLAQKSLSTLNQEYSVLDREITKLNFQLSDDRTELEQSIALESTDNLILLFKANTAAKIALTEYRRISDFLLGMSYHLHIIGESSHVLDSFIEKNDGFLVRISNFFAQIWSLFKSEAALMIDKAREIKNDLCCFGLEYRAELMKQMDVIDQNPDIDQALKIKLRRKIEFELGRKTNIIPYTNPSKDQVRYLIKSLEKLYGIKSENKLEEQNDKLMENSTAFSTLTN